MRLIAMKRTTKRLRYAAVSAATVLLIGAAGAAQADRFSIYFGYPGTHFRYDSGHGYFGHKPYYRRYHGYGYKHRYWGPRWHWKHRRYWHGHRHYSPRRHYWWHKHRGHHQGHRWRH